MAFADLGSLGAIGNTTTNQTSLALTTTQAIDPGELVVVVVAVDNPQSGGDSGVSGVTDVGGNTYTKAIQICNAVAAQGGASVSIWYSHADFAVAAGANAITATFTVQSTSDASALTARLFSLAAATDVAIEGTPGTLVGNTAADPGSLNVTTANIACLRVRGIASQVGNNTNLTPTSTWTAWANGNSATTGTTGEMCARAEHVISTATGAASDPTYVSAIYASGYVAFKEQALAAASGTLTTTDAADAAAFPSAIVEWRGTFDPIETLDAAAFPSAVVDWRGTFDIDEALDAAAMTGSVTEPGLTGTIVAIEVADVLVSPGSIIGTFLDPNRKSSRITLSGGNLTATRAS